MRPSLCHVLVLRCQRAAAVPAARRPTEVTGASTSPLVRRGSIRRDPGIVTAVMGAYGSHRRDAEGAAGQPAGAGARRVVDRYPPWLTYEFVLRRAWKFHNGERSQPEE